jgi:hypothetical protein
MPLQIATSGLGDVSITDETKLIRYMKLSTFLLLVSNNRLFLPTVRKLQESDPGEANLQLGWCQAYWRMMWPLVEPHKAWLLSDILRPDQPQALEHPSEEMKKDLVRAWASALGERRAYGVGIAPLMKATRSGKSTPSAASRSIAPWDEYALLWKTQELNPGLFRQ